MKNLRSARWVSVRLCAVELASCTSYQALAGQALHELPGLGARGRAHIHDDMPRLHPEKFHRDHRYRLLPAQAALFFLLDEEGLERFDPIRRTLFDRAPVQPVPPQVAVPVIHLPVILFPGSTGRQFSRTCGISEARLQLYRRL